MEKRGDVLVFFLNGEKVEVERPDPAQSLADYLRGEGFTGTKVGCGRGLCGACTVMLSTHDPHTKQVTHRSINACLAPLCSIDHAAITTIEGLGNTRVPGAAHPIQERFTLAHASQCGFCTPGMVMAFYALLRSHPNGLTEDDVKANIDGNLCRCTGYRPILDAMRTFAKNTECAKQEARKDENGNVVTHSLGLDGVVFHPLNLTSEPIFPPYLLTHPPRSTHFVGDTIEWFKPTSLEEALALKAKHPDAQLLAGNTRLVNRKLQPTVVISIGLIPELKSLTFNDAGLDVGAAVTFTSLRDALLDAVATQEKTKTAGFAALAEQVKWIGGTQVRNSATVGGSLVAGHIWGGQEASDLIPLLVVLGATVTLVAGGDKSRRSVPVTAFVKGGGKVDLKPDELIHSVHIPYSQPGEHVESYKQSGRQTSSASLVTGGCRLLLEQSNDNSGDWVIKSATICLGGVSPKPGQSAAKTEAYLAGKSLLGLRSDLQSVFGLLAEDYPLEGEGEGAEYKRTVISGLFFKFYSRVVAHVSSSPDGEEEDDFVFGPYRSRITRGEQRFAAPESYEVVAHPTKHTTSHIQSSGEAHYTDDLQARRMLYAAMVLSTRAHARVVRVDASPALAVNGVRAFYSAKDVPVNVGELFKDGVLFAADEVQYHGQPLGIIVADTQERASRAARLVKVEYEDLPAIITIEQGIAAASFFEKSPMFHDRVERGDVEAAFKQAHVIAEGDFHLGGALHWYMEPHSCLVEPKDDGGLLVHCTAQSVASVQEEVAFALNMHQKDVDVRVKRVGGGFGGKGTRFFMYSAAALAAKLLNRPIKHTLDRGTDTQVSGSRAPYYFKYRVGAAASGKIIAADFQVYANGGAAIDLSHSIMAETLNHLDNCYSVPNFRAVGKVIRSNIAPTKPYRGAGIPQGIIAGEFSLDHVARKLGMAPHVVRELNFYKQGEVTAAGQPLDDCSLGAVWQTCRQQSDFDRRAKEAHAFNQQSPYVKRGVATMPIKQGVGIGGAMAVWAKACALVHVLADGTVVVNHGGVEMGQGLNIKIAQLAAETLGVPLDTVLVPPTSSEVLQHGGATGGSFTFELNGSAVRKACEELNARLAPLKEAAPGKPWKDVIQDAINSRVCLSAYGWHAVDFEDRKFLYYAWGTAFAEVELDILTGSYRVLRVDVVEDVGTSINPAVDVGQVEGAFVQGVGWLTSEELKWDAHGRVDHNYEIPTPESIPVEFHVHLLKAANPRGLLSSKGIGEPPKSMGATVALAIKDAIVAARTQAGLPSEDLVLDLPLTVERVRLACGDLGLARTLQQQAEPSAQHSQPGAQPAGLARRPSA